MCEHSTTNTFNGIRDIYVDYRRRKHVPNYPGQVIPTGGVAHFFFPWQATKCLAGVSLNNQRNRSMTT